MKRTPSVSIVVMLAGLFVTACTLNPETPEIGIYMEAWYSSPDILIPFEVLGSEYAEYRYEHNAGNGWVVDVDRTIRVPNGGYGLIELSVMDLGWDHRLTISVLSQSGPGQTLEPFATAERYFHIDTTTPSAEVGSLLLRPFEDGSEIAGPPYDETLPLDVIIGHAEFAPPSGSPIRVFFTRDGSVPSERSDGTESENYLEICSGGGGPYDELYRFIVIDEAGNRSGVRTIGYSAP